MTIYLEKGFKNNRIQVLENSVNSFEWLQTYEPREIKRKNNENDDRANKSILLVVISSLMKEERLKGTMNN